MRLLRLTVEEESFSFCFNGTSTLIIIIMILICMSLSGYQVLETLTSTVYCQFFLCISVRNSQISAFTNGTQLVTYETVTQQKALQRV